MIVVDVGCAPRPRDDGTIEESVSRLIARFHPERLYGSDPAVLRTAIVEDGCKVNLKPEAAWLYDGFIGYQEQGITSYVGEMVGPAAVPCFDLAKFIRSLEDEVVLKLDCEGAEAHLLPYLHEDGADALLSLILVEWHLDPLRLPWRCPLEVWS